MNDLCGMAIGRIAGPVGLLALAFTLGGCTAFSNEAACKKEGLAEGTPAFSQCVSAKKAEAARYRSGRRRGKGAGR